jgi:HlyD family secretion protein
MMNRKLTHAGATSALIAVLAIGTACQSTEPEEPIYRLVPVSTRDINVNVTAAGAVEPVMTVEVRSKASGEIFEMRVEIGDQVRAGALLLRVDPRVPEASLRQAVADSVLAEAQYATAQSQLRRTEGLHESQSITEVEFEDARLAVASARASLISAARSLEDARISAEDTEVRAPLTGVVIDKRVEEGSVITSATGASAGSVLLQMANLDTVQIRALVDETDIGRIEPGLQVTIRADAYPNRPFRGRVLKIEPQAEVTSNVTMFPVLIRIGNEEGLLRPGMNGEVDISIGRRRGAVAVPNNALRTMRDFMSAATVLELDPQAVRQQLADARQFNMEQGDGTIPAAGDSGRRGTRWMERELPEGVSQEQVREIMGKRRTEGEESLTQEERALLERIGFTGRPPGGMNAPTETSGPSASSTNDPLAADYIVFVMRDSVRTAVRIRTGLSDGTYSEVLEGLSEGDTLIVLPSTGTRSTGGPMGGMGGGMGPPPGGRPPGR